MIFKQVLVLSELVALFIHIHRHNRLNGTAIVTVLIM